MKSYPPDDEFPSVINDGESPNTPSAIMVVKLA
jgi:hypothetical protein